MDYPLIYNEDTGFYEQPANEAVFQYTIGKRHQVNEVQTSINKISETVTQSSEVFKKLPNFPEFIEKANDAITLIAEGKLNINSGDSNAFREEKMKLKLFRNNLVGLFLMLVIFILIVFK